MDGRHALTSWVRDGCNHRFPLVPLLWDALACQLDSVRAVGLTTSSDSSEVAAPELTRERRLQNALTAIQNSGNSQMIESLQAALQGRQARLELPDVPRPGQNAMSGPEVYLSQTSERFKRNR